MSGGSYIWGIFGGNWGTQTLANLPGVMGLGAILLLLTPVLLLYEIFLFPAFHAYGFELFGQS